MANNNLPIHTPKERAAIRAAAQERKEQILQEAIRNGASVNYTDCHLTQEEWETHIMYGIGGTCIIDTTLPKDITKCLNRGWKITAITYYTDNNQVAGLVCEGKTNDVSIRKIK